VLLDGVNTFDGRFIDHQTFAGATTNFQQIPPQQSKIPQQQQQQQQQLSSYHFQEQPLQPQAQQCQQPASPDMQLTLLHRGIPFNSGLTNPLLENGVFVGFDQTDAYPYPMDAYGGVDEAVTGGLMPCHTNGPETQQLVSQHYQPGPGHSDCN